MSVHSMIAVALLAIVCFSGLTMQMPPGPGPDKPGPGPGSGPDKPGPGGPMARPPPPVNENFTMTCMSQEMRSRHISCAPDGSFDPVQCMGKKCHCVNTQTGEVLRPVDHKARNCSEGVTCKRLHCKPKICSRGYQSGPDGCDTCMCEPQPPLVECGSISELIEERMCDCSCIEIKGLAGMKPMKGPKKDSCPACNMACNDEMPTEAADMCVTSDTTCPSGSELRVVGRHGKPECVAQLVSDDVCMVTEEPYTGKGPRGRVKAGNIAQMTADCQEGFSCVQTGHRKRNCKSTQCKMALKNNTNIECNKEGNFKPLQCDPIVSAINESESGGARSRSKKRDPMMCRCVEMLSGDTIVSSEVRVEPGMKRPNCRFRDCKIPGTRGRGRRGKKERMYRVQHGDTYFDAANCRSCQCIDGDAQAFCSASVGNCEAITGQNNCTLEGGLMILHGEQMTFECEKCGCSNGKISCVTIGDCETEEVNMCQQCEMLPPNPVCGPDGRNHKTECAAVYCAGIPAIALLEGPCQSNDVCEIYPCDNDTFTCVPGGGVACVGTGGCEPDQLRTCIDLDTLQCTGNESSLILGFEVCGSDNITYSSICSLLQNTVDVQIASSGSCESEECTSIGEVCGSDGVTYPNPCVLRSQAVTRLDYPSACVTNGSTAEAICESVQTQGLCIVNTDNCDSPHLPENGCCPICGGSVTIAFDRDALTVAGSADYDFTSVDNIVIKILQLFYEIQCTVFVDVTTTYNVEMSLVSENTTYTYECVTLAKEIASTVNGDVVTTGSRRRRQTDDDESIPQIFEYAIVASTSPLVSDDSTVQPVVTDVEATTSGAPSLRVTLGALSLLVLSMLSVLLG
ncbi:protein jagged-1-like isoform X2 [Halichondria panicea]|uniref:protein jagged-1-like isoform X2 n=1 Tax=Halichondria panicea TaxID=6063 RepID=UPI00312B7F09